MGLFNSYNEIEKQLLEQYRNTFSVIGVLDAFKNAKALLNDAILKSREEGTYNLPSNFGNIILGEEKTNNPIVEKLVKIQQNFLPKKKAEGIKDEDIKWWWNLNDVERWSMVLFDNMNRVNAYLSYVQNGLSKDEATRKIWKFYPSYNWDNPDERPPKTPLFIQKREDYPLPIELKDRINIWVQKQYEKSPEETRKRIEKSSTINALVRKEIKAGNI